VDIKRITDGYWKGWFRIERPTAKVASYIRYSLYAKYRKYEDGCWYVHEKFIENIKQLAPADTNITTTASVIKDPYEVLHLRPTAPPAIIKAAWRELAKILHPDHGGNPEEFQRAKDAYEMLVKG
jgi:hypothetical protein